MATFHGTREQLLNALREIARRGGTKGAIAEAAADEIEALSHTDGIGDVI